MPITPDELAEHLLQRRGAAIGQVRRGPPDFHQGRGVERFVRIAGCGGADVVRLQIGVQRPAVALRAARPLEGRRAALDGNGGYHYPAHQTPWQEMQRGIVDQFSEGMVLKPAVKYRDVAHKSGVPRDNH